MPESKHRRRRGSSVPRGARSAGTLAASRPRRKKTNRIYLIASVAIAVLVIAGFAVGGLGRGGGGGAANTGSNERYVDGVGVQELITSANHVPEGQAVEYSSYPPTSGDHWELGPAACGFYAEGLPDEQIVHNLEHGNILVSYNFTGQQAKDQLRTAIDSIDQAGEWGVVRFYDKIPEGTVAVAAWGRLDLMQGVEQDRIARFFATFAGNLGPERIPC